MGERAVSFPLLSEPLQGRGEWGFEVSVSLHATFDVQHTEKVQSQRGDPRSESLFLAGAKSCWV